MHRFRFLCRYKYGTVVGVDTIDCLENKKYRCLAKKGSEAIIMSYLVRNIYQFLPFKSGSLTKSNNLNP